jgi:hypothetical protein
MLFSYKTSNKKLLGIGFSLVVNLALFFVFSYLNSSLSDLSIIFFASSIMYLVLFILQYLKSARFEFFENEIHIHTKQESKVLSHLNLLYVHSFILQRNAKEKIHLVTGEGEFTFTDGEDPNFTTLQEYLYSHAKDSVLAKYYYHIKELKHKIPSMIASLAFLVIYLYYFNALGMNSIFFKVILFVQGGSLLMYAWQWFSFSQKIKNHTSNL